MPLDQTSPTVQATPPRLDRGFARRQVRDVARNRLERGAESARQAHHRAGIVALRHRFPEDAQARDAAHRRRDVAQLRPDVQDDLGAALGGELDVAQELHCIAEALLGMDEQALAAQVFARPLWTGRQRPLARVLRQLPARFEHLPALLEAAQAEQQLRHVPARFRIVRPQADRARIGFHGLLLATALRERQAGVGVRDRRPGRDPGRARDEFQGLCGPVECAQRGPQIEQHLQVLRGDGERSAQRRLRRPGIAALALDRAQLPVRFGAARVELDRPPAGALGLLEPPLLAREPRLFEQRERLGMARLRRTRRLFHKREGYTDNRPATT